MTNRFFIYTNDSKKSKLAKAKLVKSLRANKCVISEDATNIIVLGGDGTFVHAFNKYCNKKVKLALLNTGFVGFYSIDLKLDAKAIIKYFNDEKNFYTPEVVKCETSGKKFYAINEIVIEGINTMSCDCFINNHFYEKFWGSGLCFATKTGSTGFNKSLGSSILLTKNNIWQMTEISPLAHAKYLSIGNSLVLDGKQKVTVKNLRANGNLTLMNDGYEHSVSVEESFKLSLAHSKAKIAFCKDLKPYLNKLQQVFIIGGKK